MKKPFIKEPFVFVGYQLRKLGVCEDNLTLATNVNPLYLPKDKALMPKFEKLLSSCQLPFFIDDPSVLVQLCRIACSDTSVKNDHIMVVHCALLEQQLSDAYCEYYDPQGKIIRESFIVAHSSKEAKIASKIVGFDVLDVTDAGGIDSAMHTYCIRPQELNSNGLICDLAEAWRVKRRADEELPEHGPFTIWEIGSMPAISALITAAVV